VWLPRRQSAFWYFLLVNILHIATVQLTNAFRRNKVWLKNTMICWQNCIRPSIDHPDEIFQNYIFAAFTLWQKLFPERVELISVKYLKCRRHKYKLAELPITRGCMPILSPLGVVAAWHWVLIMVLVSVTWWKRKLVLFLKIGLHM